MAARVGKLGKPECYYFPKQLNNYTGEANYTYFGFDPDVTVEEVRERILKFSQDDTRITELSRAYRVVLGTGWYTPPGVIHAPASVLTYEPQWNSDVNSVYENIVSGEVYPPEMLVEELPENEKSNIDSVIKLLDWEKNTDTHYRKHYFRPPVSAGENDQYSEKWIALCQCLCIRQRADDLSRADGCDHGWCGLWLYCYTGPWKIRYT